MIMKLRLDKDCKSLHECKAKGGVKFCINRLIFFYFILGEKWMVLVVKWVMFSSDWVMGRGFVVGLGRG